MFHSLFLSDKKMIHLKLIDAKHFKLCNKCMLVIFWSLSEMSDLKQKNKFIPQIFREKE